MAHAEKREEMTKRDDESKAPHTPAHGSVFPKDHHKEPPKPIDEELLKAMALNDATEHDIKGVIARRKHAALEACTLEELHAALASKTQRK